MEVSRAGVVQPADIERKNKIGENQWWVIEKKIDLQILAGKEPLSSLC